MQGSWQRAVAKVTNHQIKPRVPPPGLLMATRRPRARSATADSGACAGASRAATSNHSCDASSSSNSVGVAKGSVLPGRGQFEVCEAGGTLKAAWQIVSGVGGGSGWH